MTSPIMPSARGVKSDGRGNAELEAYDGTRVVIQRRDLDDIIDRLIDIRDRFQSMHPVGPALVDSQDDTEDE